MADPAVFERLQPSLLDRLTDERPGDMKETRDERVIDIRRLRDIVQRDLSWLLNTYNNNFDADLTRFPNVARSVVTYGVREVAGDYSTAAKAEMIRKSIREAIEIFEPRLRKGSIEVEFRNKNLDDEKAVLSFDIRADMWAEPVPLELYLRSEIDMTTGNIKVERSS